MGLKINSGWIQTAITLAATAACVKWPEQRGILAPTLLGAAGLVFVFGFSIDGFRIRQTKRRRRMIPLIGMVTCAVGFVSFAAIYFWPAAKPEISWNFDEAGDGYFLGMTGSPNEAAEVLSFQAKGHNNLDDPIIDLSGYVRSDRTNDQFPLYFSVNGIRVKPENTNGIPIGADFLIDVPFTHDEKQIGTFRMPTAKFLADFAPFTFIYKYQGKTFTRRFELPEIEAVVQKFERVTRQAGGPPSVVVKQPK
jgi:hypothetical protein